MNVGVVVVGSLCGGEGCEGWEVGWIGEKYGS